jgi:hypothetical protein
VVGGCLRLNPRVVDWLRGKGVGRLTRINDILNNLMEAERRIGSGRWCDPRSQKRDLGRPAPNKSSALGRDSLRG